MKAETRNSKHLVGYQTQQGSGLLSHGFLSEEEISLAYLASAYPSVPERPHLHGCSSSQSPKQQAEDKEYHKA